jgi:hypothetical protein
LFRPHVPGNRARFEAAMAIPSVRGRRHSRSSRTRQSVHGVSDPCDPTRASRHERRASHAASGARGAIVSRHQFAQGRRSPRGRGRSRHVLAIGRSERLPAMPGLERSQSMWYPRHSILCRGEGRAIKQLQLAASKITSNGVVILSCQSVDNAKDA